MKKLPETDAIFDRLAQVNPAADADETILRLSVDAKATISLGLFSRGGYSRLTIKAWDHDFKSQQKIADRFPTVRTLLLNLDNGPENHSRRTQFMKRLTELVDECHLTIELAYYPPYHSKYNPIERVWGVLEQHWNGVLLDSLNTVLQFAKTMTYNRVHPIVKQISKTYHTGIKLSQQAMAELEQRFERLAGLEKYFVRISPLPA